MKALSVVQPWAWLIMHGGKTIENRTWNTRYRGRVLIHASGRTRGLLETHYQACMFVQRAFGVERAASIPFSPSGNCALEFGGIIGAVTIVDVLPPTPTPSNPWHMPEYFGFVLADPEPLPFLRCGGALSLWGNFDVRNGEAVAL